MQVQNPVQIMSYGYGKERPVQGLIAKYQAMIEKAGLEVVSIHDAAGSNSTYFEVRRADGTTFQLRISDHSTSGRKPYRVYNYETSVQAQWTKASVAKAIQYMTTWGQTATGRSANPPHIAQKLWDQARMDGYEWGVRYRRRKGSRMPILAVQGRMADEYVERLPESYRLTREDKAYIHAGYAVGLRRGIAGGEPPKMPNPKGVQVYWDGNYHLAPTTAAALKWIKDSLSKDPTSLPSRVEITGKGRVDIDKGNGIITLNSRSGLDKQIKFKSPGNWYASTMDGQKVKAFKTYQDAAQWLDTSPEANAMGHNLAAFPRRSNPAAGLTAGTQLDEAIAAAGMAGLDWHAKHPRLAKQKARVNAASAAPSARIAKRYGITGRGSRAGVKAVRDAWKLGAMGGGVAASGNPSPQEVGSLDEALQLAHSRANNSGEPQAVIRLRGRHWVVPATTARKTKTKILRLIKPSHKNPFDGDVAVADADRLYESFHGKAPTKTTVVHTPTAIRDSLSELGLLRQLKVKLLTGKRVAIDFPDSGRDAVMLCSSPDGRQLYFVGGDQSINLRSAGMAGQPWERDHMALGVLLEVTYRTTKGFDKFQLTDYYHKLGEETKVQPILAYDTLNSELSVVGGQYKVKPEGIVN